MCTSIVEVLVVIHVHMFIIDCAGSKRVPIALSGARLWNSLPPDIIACDTLPRFRRELKTFLFGQSYPSIVF